jgi:hypothetical protein
MIIYFRKKGAIDFVAMVPRAVCTAASMSTTFLRPKEDDPDKFMNVTYEKIFISV